MTEKFPVRPKVSPGKCIALIPNSCTTIPKKFGNCAKQRAKPTSVNMSNAVGPTSPDNFSSWPSPMTRVVIFCGPINAVPILLDVLVRRKIRIESSNWRRATTVFPKPDNLWPKTLVIHPIYRKGVSRASNTWLHCNLIDHHIRKGMCISEKTTSCKRNQQAKSTYAFVFLLCCDHRPLSLIQTNVILENKLPLSTKNRILHQVMLISRLRKYLVILSPWSSIVHLLRHLGHLETKHPLNRWGLGVW